MEDTFSDCKHYVVAVINTLMSMSDRLGHFLSKHGKGTSYAGPDSWKNCSFPASGGILILML